MLYLDHNSTTAVDPSVLEEMLPWLGPRLGNPSSIHTFGQEARRALDKARAQVAHLIGAQPDELVFTSGGTESNNLALLGTVASSRCPHPRMAASAIEHHSVLTPCRHVAERGGTLLLLGVDGDGLLELAAARSSLCEGMLMASLMLANNDMGTLQPVGALSERARELGIVLHSDAVQAAGKIPIDVKALGVDMLSLSGHKLHGPKGMGALFLRRGTPLSALSFGGHQERGLRPGTENVAAIVGFGKACELAAERLQEDAAHMGALRASFEAAALERLPGVVVNAQAAPRLSNTSNLSFEGLDGEALAIKLELLGLCISTGAACSSLSHEPSHILMAMGRSPAQARSSLRFSFGRENSQEEVLRAVEILVQATQSMREGR
ncbi:MAG: cysteine desulfurase [Cystobacterineae bacterium]|nr:cysteine desulfurase [Cystobacterineae bacterium]